MEKRTRQVRTTTILTLNLVHMDADYKSFEIEKNEYWWKVLTKKKHIVQIDLNL